MIIEVVTAAWFCFGAAGVCYDTAHVAVVENEVATMLTDGESLAGLVVNCKTRTHRVMMGGEAQEGAFEPGSIAEYLCVKYLPTS